MEENTFSTGIGPITDKVLNNIVDRLATDNFRDKLTDKFVAPITNIAKEKAKPYIHGIIGLHLIIIILLFYLIYLTKIKK